MRRLAIGLFAGALLASCRSSAGKNQGPYADKLDADVPQIEKALGVKFKTPPKVAVRTRDQVRAFLMRTVNDPKTQQELANEAAVYKLLGLIPDSLQYRDLLVRLLSEQVLGYYDPATKVLYVVDGAPEDYVGITIMHELIHALQDQYVNLDSLEHLRGDDDRELAAQAVIEGQATYWQVYLMAGGAGNIPVQLPGGWEALRSAIRDAKETQPVLAAAPTVIQEELLFPYINGSDFIRRYAAKYPNRLPFDSMPISTDQVMHDASYFGPRRHNPALIVLPHVAGEVAQNDFGEFGTRLYFYTHLREPDLATHDSARVAQAARSASGWDGDRYVLVKLPNGANGLAWVSVWDTPTAAANFSVSMDDVMLERFNVKPAVSGGVRRYTSPTRTVEVSSREIGGRSVVLYVEVPAGASTAILDLSKVRVTSR